MAARITVSPNHRPFEVRKLIIVLSILGALLVTFLFGSFLVGGVTYFTLAVALDLIIHKVFKFKASYWCVARDLQRSEKISPQDLDTYFESRLQIRLTSFALGITTTSLALVTPYAWTLLFCFGYVGATVLSIFYFRLYTSLKRPEMFRTYDLNDSEQSEMNYLNNAWDNDLYNNPKYSRLFCNIFNR